jgi:hypothetical protein
VARLDVDGDELVLDLSGLEKAEGFHGSIRVPVSAVRDLRYVEDPWSELRGMRAPGTGLPGVVAVGTRRGSGYKDFAAIHGKGPGILVELEGAEFERLVVSADDASEAAALLRRQLHLD